MLNPSRISSLHLPSLSFVFPGSFFLFLFSAASIPAFEKSYLYLLPSSFTKIHSSASSPPFHFPRPIPFFHSSLFLVNTTHFLRFSYLFFTRPLPPPLPHSPPPSYFLFLLQLASQPKQHIIQAISNSAEMVPRMNVSPRFRHVYDTISNTSGCNHCRSQGKAVLLAIIGC